MDAAADDALDRLRAALDRDIDEASVSLVPPSALIGLLPRDEATGLAVYLAWARHVLRRLVRGMAVDEVSSLAESYLGAAPPLADQLVRDLRRTCEYADRIRAVVIARDEALRQMMTWKNAERRMVEGLLDTALAVYEREGISAFTVPMGDHAGPDGDIHNTSFATSSPHVRLRFLRLLRYDGELRSLLVPALRAAAVAMAAVAGAIALYAHRHWAWGTLLALVALVSLLLSLPLLFLPRIARFMRTVFDSALLTAAAIESVEPLTVLCIAEMSNAHGAGYWGIKRLRPRGLPLHRLRAGERVPCVSTFTQGDAEDRWVDFSPRPIAWGTGDAAKIGDLLVKLGDEAFAALDRCHRERLLPKGDELVVVDESFRRVAPGAA